MGLALKQNRFSEELLMRHAVVDRLRTLWPSARIIHELPLRYSTNRIDVAAVTPDFIAAVEIKSSKDDTSRLRAQLRGFEPISTYMICAVSPAHWAEDEREVKELKRGGTQYRHIPCETKRIIRDEVGSRCGVWLVTPGEPIRIESDHYEIYHRPCAARLLDLLHVSELTAIASRRSIFVGRTPNHKTLRDALTDHLPGRDARREAYAALMARDAFDKASDPPITPQTQGEP